MARGTEKDKKERGLVAEGIRRQSIGLLGVKPWVHPWTRVKKTGEKDREEEKAIPDALVSYVGVLGPC